MQTPVLSSTTTTAPTGILGGSEAPEPAIRDKWPFTFGGARLVALCASAI